MDKQTILLITFTGLILEFVIWFITDPRDYKHRIEDSFNRRRLSAYLSAAGFLMVYLLTSLYLSWPSSSQDSTWITIGLIVYVFGMFFAIWAKLTMSKNWGLPAQHDNKRQSELVTSGPFSYTRNPIYVGNFLLIVGFSLAMRSYSILLTPIVYIAIYKAVEIEEKLLRKKFGSQYEKYMKKVPRFI